MVDSPDLIVPTRLVPDCDCDFSPAERETLRALAGQAAELAARPLEAEKCALWKKHNALQPTRPVIFCDPENGWNEIFPPDSLACQASFARQWEFHLRKQIFWGAQMGDDYTVLPFFPVEHARQEPDWGLRQFQIGGAAGGAYRWDAPVMTESDLSRLHYPLIRVDFEGTQRLAELANSCFGDLLPVRVKTSWWWTVGLTQTLVYLRGLEQMLYDMTDNPALLHRLMALLSGGTLAMLDALEAHDLLSLNCDGSYVGSGGLGWIDTLPGADFSGKVRTVDMWGLGESQETIGVSPRMFVEFIFPYQLPLLQRFGLTCYGCCEPVDGRWSILQQVSNLRRVSISPWSDRAKMAERLGDRYIFSLKPNPAALAAESFDEQRIRASLRADLQAARNCRVEVIMKDNHTIRHDPTRLTRWCRIAREEAERT
jgi:hypothetical protein